jgi:ATP-binding cassette subfamily B protein
MPGGRGGFGGGGGRFGGRGGDQEFDARYTEPQLPSSKQRYRKFRKERHWKNAIGSPRGTPVGGKAPPRSDWQARRSYLRDYWRLVRPYRRVVVLLIALGALAGLCNTVGPYLTKFIIDDALLAEGLTAAEKTKKLFLLGGAAMGLVLLARALDMTRNINTIALNHKIVIRLRRRLLRHMLRLSLGDLYDLKTGTVVSRLSNDVDKGTGLLQQAVMSPVAALFNVVFATIIVFQENWRLALACWAVLPFMIAVSLLWVKRIRPIFRSAGRDRNIIDGRATETFSGIRVVRTFRREPRERADYTVADDTMIRKRLYGLYSAMVVDSAWQVLIPVSVLTLVIVGGYFVIHDNAVGSTIPVDDRTTIGQILAFQALMPALLMPIFRIVSSFNSMQESLAAMERVFEIFDMPPDKPDKPGAVEAPQTVESIDFKKLYFAYAPGEPVIRDFNLHVPGGSIVAFVGPSGAGKTTMTDLIARFYDPTEGAIELNGTDIREMKLQSYRSLLAVVPQETFLFDGTVKQNISYGRRGASDAQVIAAAERANAMAFIRELPKGLESMIGERGIKLSGGQRQRIAIARAILADPRILIMSAPCPPDTRIAVFGLNQGSNVRADMKMSALCPPPDTNC